MEGTNYNQTVHSKRTDYKVAFLIAISILAVSFVANIYFVFNLTITGQVVGNQTITNIQNLPEWAQQKISDLTDQLVNAQADSSSYKQQLDSANINIQELKNKLDLFSITVSGNVKTVGEGTSPVSLTFDDGSGKHIFNVNSGTYVANLPNDNIYTIIVAYSTYGIPSPIPCTPKQNQLRLYVDDKSQVPFTADWSC